MLGLLRDASTYLWGFIKPHRSFSLEEGQDDVHYRWRVRVTAIIVILAFLFGGHVLTAKVFPWGGRVAMASDTKALDDQLKLLLEQSTNTYKITLGQEICRVYFLRKGTSGPLYETLNKAYEEKQTTYKGLNKDNRFPIAECAQPKAA